MKKQRKIKKKMVTETRTGTAKNAVKLLLSKNIGFIEPNKVERLNILIAFAKRNKVIYGKAFDLVKVKDNLNLEDLDEVERNFDSIVLYEVKSTSLKKVEVDFKKYFFGLTTAELLVAQNLKDSFKFMFVNTNTGDILELTLKQIFEKAKGIYPVWSIQF